MDKTVESIFFIFTSYNREIQRNWEFDPIRMESFQLKNITLEL